MNDVEQFAPPDPDLFSGIRNSLQLEKVLRLTVSLWIYNWGYTSNSIIRLMLGGKDAAYASRLVQRGWLTATSTASRLPPEIFTLTPKALKEVKHFAAETSYYKEIKPHKVSERLIRHNLIAQELTVMAFQTGLVANYRTERFFSDVGDKLGIKRPDVMWIFKSGVCAGVEVELTKKEGQQLDEFILGIWNAIEPKGFEKSGYDRFMVFSDSKTLIDSYQSAIRPGHKLQLWKRTLSGKWSRDGQERVPAWLIQKVDFSQIND